MFPEAEAKPTEILRSRAKKLTVSHGAINVHHKRNKMTPT